MEEGLVERFNNEMETVLDLLDYENVERVWMERRATSGSHPDDAAFDLHIVREGSDGVVYEDGIHTLSESERTVIGLVVALSGHLVHRVHEEVPFILLDSVEAIDAERLSRLLDYFSQYADYLVMALLPEDEKALDAEYETVGADILG